MNKSFSKLNCISALHNNFSKFITLIILCILVHTNTLYAQKSCEVTLNSKIKLKNSESIKVFLRTSDSVIKNTFISKTKKNNNLTRNYKVTVLKNIPHKNVKFQILKDGILSIELPKFSKELKDTKFAPEIIGALILKYCKQSISEQNIKKLPPWLIYSLLGKVKNRLDKSSIPGIFFVPAVHAFISSDDDKSLLKIVESKTYPKTGPSHQLYVELSQILLDSIRKLPKWREGLFDLVDLSLSSTYQPAYFEQIFSKKVNTYIANTTIVHTNQTKNDNDFELENWFYKNAVQLSVNIFNPANAAFSEKLYRKIEIVKYPAQVEDADGNLIQEERYCKLSDLPDKQSEIVDFNSLIKEKEYEFALLGYCVPYNFQPAIFKIKKALINLRINNNADLFKEEYEKQKKIFFNQISKQYQQEAYLKKSEQQYVPEMWKYRYEFIEIEKYHKKNKNRWPALTHYLNSYENKLKKTTK